MASPSTVAVVNAPSFVTLTHFQQAPVAIWKSHLDGQIDKTFPHPHLLDSYPNTAQIKNWTPNP